MPSAKKQPARATSGRPRKRMRLRPGLIAALIVFVGVPYAKAANDYVRTKLEVRQASAEVDALRERKQELERRLNPPKPKKKPAQAKPAVSAAPAAAPAG